MKAKRQQHRQQNIEVTVAPDGGITIEAEGYTGSTCEEATRFLEEALGLPAQRTRKADFYKRNARTDNRQQLGSS